MYAPIIDLKIRTTPQYICNHVTDPNDAIMSLTYS
jgi:hypothetical protein